MPFFVRRITQLIFILGLIFASAGGLAQAQTNAACDTASTCFTISLPTNLTGDVYLDGNLIVASVNKATLTTTPAVVHLVEVRNIQDAVTPGFGDLFVYPDQKQSNATGSAGRTRTVSFFPQKNFVKGVLELTCDARGRKASDTVACRPMIDGVVQADLAPNGKASYNLVAGPHAIHTELIGDQANNWSPITRDDTVTLNAGRSTVQVSRLKATFNLKGSIKISLSPKNLVADLYVDGVMVAAQSASIEFFTAPGPHVVEVKAVTDPAANGAYKYEDAKQSVTVSAASARTATLFPKKTWLMGMLNISCQLTNKATTDDVQCVVSADDAPLGTIVAGQKATFNLTPGAHKISIATGGAQAEKWTSPVESTQTIRGGSTTFYTPRFTLKPVVGPAPAPGGGGTKGPGINHLGTEKVVMADYFMFWEPSTFTSDLMWDVPAAGGYNSDDGGTIGRHVAQAQQACLNGFLAHWIGSNEPRTTANFNQLLAASGGTNLRHAIVLIGNSFGHGEDQLIASLKFVLDNWGQHPNYLRLGGKPVIVFTDMPRPWGSDAAAVEGWKRVRAAVDPDHNSIWMAEGLTTVYNPTFDGLYVYRVDHRDFPSSWTKQPRWANALRAAERQSGVGLYFADTIAPGFDDTRSVNLVNDARAFAPHFARDRRNGGYYADTFAPTAQTGGDMLFVKSFNEWIEGTEIEPGATYGDLYLNLTCQYANTYRGR